MPLYVDKPDSMQNEKVRIFASDLQPNAIYRFNMRLEHNYGTHKAFAVFRTDAAGHVDLETTAPIRGSYHGVEPMGLFMTMMPCEDFEFGGYLRCTPPLPFYYNLELVDSHENLIDAIVIKKHWAHPSLTRTEIDQDGFCGTLYRPPGDGPFPCVIDISGTGGGIHEHKGAMMASEGFVVFCLAFFQYKHLPRHLEDVDVTYFKKPIDWFLSLPCTTSMLGIQGVSFGATIVDVLATRFPQIKAVVSINGLQAMNNYSNIKENGKTMPLTFVDDQIYQFINGIIKTSQNFKTMTAHITPETEIPWGRIPTDTKFRVIGSVDDMCQPSTHATLYRQRRLKETGHDVEIELVNGGHIMEPPYFPHHEFVYAKFQGFICGYGGEVQLHAKSQERTWANTIAFFKRSLGQPATMPDWPRLSHVVKPPSSRLASHI